MWLWWWIACAAPAPEATPRPPLGGDSAAGVDSVGGAETGAAVTDTASAPRCDPVPSDYSDPLQSGVSLNVPALTDLRLIHMVDVEVDREAERVYAVGQGGLMAFDVSGGPPVYQSIMYGGSELLEVEVLRGDRVAVGHRDAGWRLLDFADPAAPRMVLNTPGAGVAVLKASGAALYALHYGGLMEIFDQGTGEKMNQIEGVAASPWAMASRGGWGYIADHSRGVVVVDLSDPRAPELMGAVVPTAGGAQDVAVEGDTLVVAAGAAGVELFSLADPGAPVQVALVPYGDAILSVDIEGGLIWATNYSDVLAIDARDPANPVPLGSHPTLEWAMDVASLGDGRAVVADWSRLNTVRAAPNARAPDADVSRDALIFGGDAAAALTLSNRGGADLLLREASVDDPRFEVTGPGPGAVIPPGQSAEMEVAFIDDGRALDGALCLSTDDPDQPVIEVALTWGVEGASVAVGEAAIDFVLPDLDGGLHQLSEHLGQPVFLVFFATW